MRKYGQHFLINERVINDITAAVPAAATDVVEIGPGRGALTEKLLAREFSHFTAVEIDPEMCAYLARRFPLLDGRLVQADFLQFEMDKLPARPTFFVSNLPYIDAADILDKVLAWTNFAGAVFMFQKEQAQRILARAGQAGYGPLTILTQVRARAALLCKVGRACFNPPPKVESAVLTFEKIPCPLSPKEYARFARLIKAAFLHRRKTLFNSLTLAGYPKDKLSAAFLHTGIPEKIRPEQMEITAYLRLLAALY